VVGYSLVAPANAFIPHAFVYDLPNGPMIDILPRNSAKLFSVNNAGDAVGATFDFGRPVRAMLWQNGAVIDLTNALNDPSWQLVSAVAINDRGMITGTGTHNGVGHAYVLIPR
jgi:hypothetical protein